MLVFNPNFITSCPKLMHNTISGTTQWYVIFCRSTDVFLQHRSKENASRKKSHQLWQILYLFSSSNCPTLIVLRFAPYYIRSVLVRSSFMGHPVYHYVNMYLAIYFVLIICIDRSGRSLLLKSNIHL